jgi:C-terminal processing protease CtpA/Prc
VRNRCKFVVGEKQEAGGGASRSEHGSCRGGEGGIGRRWRQQMFALFFGGKKKLDDIFFVGSSSAARFFHGDAPSKFRACSLYCVAFYYYYFGREGHHVSHSLAIFLLSSSFASAIYVLRRRKSYRHQATMSLISLKKRPEEIIHALAEKKSKDQTIGITLNYWDGGKILVRHVFEDGIFADSELKAGHIITSVNDTSVKGLSTLQVMDILKDAEGEVSVMAEDIGLRVVSATKESINQKVGIGLKDRDGKVIISSISEDSLFANTDLQVGHQLIGVNGTSCRGLNKNQAIVLFKELEGLTVMGQEIGLISAVVKKESANTKVGIGLREIAGKIIVSSISGDSLFKDTKLKPGLRLLFVNKTSCEGITRDAAILPFKEAEGEITVVCEDVGYVAAIVEKADPEESLGIGLKELNGHIVVSSVKEESLFEFTDIKPGLRLVCINNTLTKGLTKHEAILLLKEAVGKITVIVEKVGVIHASAFKESPSVKVGIGLKTVKGYAVISSLAEDGLFADSDLRIGMRLVSVNGKNCMQMDKMAAIKIFKETEGTLDVMAEEFGLIGATVVKNSESDKVGIGLKEVNGDVLISSIYDSGLFTKTDLKNDLRLVSVNEVSVKGLSRNEAIRLFKEAKGSITVMAEDMSTRSLIA